MMYQYVVSISDIIKKTGHRIKKLKLNMRRLPLWPLKVSLTGKTSKPCETDAGTSYRLFNRI